MCNNEQPLVSIITVTLNSERHLEDTIKSIAGQTYPNIEYIIIDGGSVDSTPQIIRKYRENIVRWISEPDQGIYDAMNKGIKMSTGEIIGIINSDDWYELDTVERVVRESLEHPESDVFHGDLMIFSPEGERIFLYKPDPDFKNIWHDMTILHPTCFVRKSIYKKHGLFSDQYRIVADYEFIIRLFKAGVGFRYINRVLANQRIGGISCTRDRDAIIENRKIVISHGLSPFTAYYDMFFKLTKRRISKFLERHDLKAIIELKKRFQKRKYYRH
ncbi:glycosyltransferase family 2 protein [Phosphitispora sp. TUW77]|uniref:glycosyltransferase family 2 protein n=1 Tax=Phosphitispora sp. TUW77 TaxID=3152361 RepID=UPI003AB68F1D